MKNIPIMVDTKRITSKPTPDETKGEHGIWGRCLLEENYLEVNQDELLEILASGRSIIPSKTKRKNNNKMCMIESRIVILDVDNMGLGENGKPIPLSKDDPKYLSIEKALEISIVKNGAFALQKSIRYSEKSERFRIVFLLKTPNYHWKENEKVYKYLQKKIPYCDEKVNVSTRIFYGGKSDENAVISIGNIFDNSALIFEDSDEIHGERKVILPVSMTESTTDFVEMIRKGDQDTMKKWFGTLFDPKNMTIDDTYNQLLQTDMKDMLKTNSNNFCCLFHNDNHPSGAIYKGDNGNYYYKCHSESCGVKGDFLSLVQGVLNYNSRVEAFNWFLEKMDLYPKEYQDLIEQMSVGFETLTSYKDNLHKTIRDKLPEMRDVYSTLLYGVYFSADNDGNVISIMSGNLLTKRMEYLYGHKRNYDYLVDKCNKILSFMTFIGMLEKLDDGALSIGVKQYLEQVANQVQANKEFEHTSYKVKHFEPKRANVYRLCKLDDLFFKRLWDEIVPTMKEFHFTYQYFSYTWVSLCFDETKAKQVFPQNEKGSLSEKKEEILKKAIIILNRLDPLKDYVITEKELIKEVSQCMPNYNFISVKDTLKENRGYFVKSGYYLFRATNEIKKLLNLEGARSCMVYSVVSPHIEEPLRKLILNGTLIPMYQIRVFTPSDGKRVTKRGKLKKLN